MINYVVWANVACLANVILCSVNVNRSAFTCCGLLSSFCSYVLLSVDRLCVAAFSFCCLGVRIVIAAKCLESMTITRTQ